MNDECDAKITAHERGVSDSSHENKYFGFQPKTRTK
jgi:hypothetical protein